MKKISMVLSVLVVIAALFANTEVMAIDPCTQIWGPPVIQVEQMPPPDGRYKWTYQFTGTVTPSTLLYILAPVCTPATTYTINPAGQVLAPGVGDSTTGFGVGDFSNVVIKMTFQSPNNFYFYTDKLVPFRSTSLQYKAGRSYSICAVQGPACPGIPSADAIRPITECKTLGEYFILITRDPSTRCATRVQQCTDAACTTGCEDITPETATVDEQTLIGCITPDGNQLCQECIIYGASSPGCYTYSSGGTTYKLPRNCQ